MPRFTTTTTTSPEWKLELDEAKIAEPVARVIRDEIAAAIRALPVDPVTGRKPFNNTGHLVNGLTIEKNSDGSWSVVAPSDRLQDPRMMARLLELVPLIGDPMLSPRVQAAVAASLDALVGL